MTPDTNPLTESHWLLDQLDDLHPPATHVGDRVRRITRDLRGILTDQDKEATRLAAALHEELDRQKEEGT